MRKVVPLSVQRDEIRLDLAELIGEARRLNRWLKLRGQDVWLSPDELARGNAKGEYLYGAANWEIRRSDEREAELEAKIAKARADLDTFRARVRGMHAR